MADAFLIETGGDTAGIVVMENTGFRFFASEPAFYALDGMVFDTIGEVHVAVRKMRLDRFMPETTLEAFQPAA